MEDAYSGGRVLKRGSGSMFSRLSQESVHRYYTGKIKKEEKKNNSSIGFHLLSFGSDKNMPQKMNCPELSIDTEDSRTGHILWRECAQLTERKDFLKRGKKELLVQPGNILPRRAHPRSPR